MLKVYVALGGDKFLEEKSIGYDYMCENNVWPKKLQMVRSWESSREIINSCFPCS